MIMIIVVTIIIANAIITIIMAVMMLTRCFDGLVQSGQTHHRPETVRQDAAAGTKVQYTIQVLAIATALKNR